MTKITLTEFDLTGSPTYSLSVEATDQHAYVVSRLRETLHATRADKSGAAIGPKGEDLGTFSFKVHRKVGRKVRKK